MQFCPFCGQKNEVTTLTCVRCGELQPRAVDPTPSRRLGGVPSVPLSAGGVLSPTSAWSDARALHMPTDGATTGPRAWPRNAHGSPRAATGGSTKYLDPRGLEPRTDAKPVSLSASSMRGRVKLVVEQGLILGEQFLLVDSEILIGRADATTCPDIDLAAHDPNYVHRAHAVLRFDPAGHSLTLFDLGGRNGIYVNNRSVPSNGSSPVKLGDKIRIGRVVMRLVLAPEADRDDRH